MKVKRDFAPVEIKLENQSDYQAFLDILNAAEYFAERRFDPPGMQRRDGDLCFKIKQFRDALMDASTKGIR